MYSNENKLQPGFPTGWKIISGTGHLTRQKSSMFFKRQLVLLLSTLLQISVQAPVFLQSFFLNNGNKVFAVEPNKEMRDASVKLLSKYEHVASINGTAENTTLQDDSADLRFCSAGFSLVQQVIDKN